uniref:Uncharacterized protein n=1 Tax=Cannabis sativa TaxID=3483 RepID=A0A803QP31_CANSA
MKEVNSKAMATIGVAKKVNVKIDGWEGQLDLVAVFMDDFDVVLGMEFLADMGAIPIPATGNLLIMGEKPSMVPTKVRHPLKFKLLSALQLKRGLKKKRSTFVIASALYDAKAGRLNQIVDAFSRKADLATLKVLVSMSTSRVGTLIKEHIKENLEKEPVTKNIMGLARKGKTTQFWVEDDLLWAKGGHLFILKTRRCSGLHEDLSRLPAEKGGETQDARVVRAFIGPKQAMASNLKPYDEDLEDPTHNQSTRDNIPIQ